MRNMRFKKIFINTYTIITPSLKKNNKKKNSKIEQTR